MYGMVNKFISTTVINRYGQKEWDKINSKLPFTTDTFIEMQSYTDDVTFGIVGTAVEVLDVDIAKFLEEMGFDWVLETSKGSYQSMYSMVSGGMYEFIENLNNMHHVISSQLSEITPPSFLCQKGDENDIYVKYFSERDGLEPFVLGLLSGLSAYFKEPATIELLSTKNTDQPFSEFKITLK